MYAHILKLARKIACYRFENINLRWLLWKKRLLVKSILLKVKHTHTPNHQLQYGDVLHCDFHRAKLLFRIPLFITVCYIDFSFSILAFDMNVDCFDISFKCNRIISIRRL